MDRFYPQRNRLFILFHSIYLTDVRNKGLWSAFEFSNAHDSCHRHLACTPGPPCGFCDPNVCTIICYSRERELAGTAGTWWGITRSPTASELLYQRLVPGSQCDHTVKPAQKNQNCRWNRESCPSHTKINLFIEITNHSLKPDNHLSWNIYPVKLQVLLECHSFGIPCLYCLAHFLSVLFAITRP